MDRHVWDDQCEDCGKRFPSLTKLHRHRRVVHGPKIKCRYCWWSCNSNHTDRLRKHEHSAHHQEMFTPAETPTVHRSVSSVVVPMGSQRQPQDLNTRESPKESPIQDRPFQEITKELDEAMPDFADLLRFEPRTPSPLRMLRDEAPIPEPPPAVMIPSNVLFERYLEGNQTPTAIGAYSPSDSPFINRENIETQPPITQESPCPTTVLLPAQDTGRPIDLSLKSKPITPNADHTKPTEVIEAPASPSLNQESPCPTTVPSPALEDRPLDLSLTSKPTTQDIDCTKPTEKWNIPAPLDPIPTVCYDFMCMDPRLFFAGAPSSYMKHPLAETLQEKVKQCRKDQGSRYQRRHVPIGVKTILKEERCYLPDGTIYELRDIWTAADNTAEE